MGKEKSKVQLKDYLLEDLDFVLGSMDEINEENRQMIIEYISKSMNDTQGDEMRKISIKDYEEKIESIKEEIKYLKKIKKKKKDLEEKELKRYKVLRKLYKKEQLEDEWKEEYYKLRKKFKGKSHH